MSRDGIFSEKEEYEMDNAFDELYQNYYVVMKCRKGGVNLIPKSIPWHDDILASMDENRIRQILGVNRPQFNHI